MVFRVAITVSDLPLRAEIRGNHVVTIPLFPNWAIPNSYWGGGYVNFASQVGKRAESY